MMTVAILRSPSIEGVVKVSGSRLPGTGLGEDSTGPAEESGFFPLPEVSERGVPHIQQNRYSSGFSNPQLAQTWARRAPHIPQNFKPDWLSKPQFLHFIGITNPRL